MPKKQRPQNRKQENEQRNTLNNNQLFETAEEFGQRNNRAKELEQKNNKKEE